MGDTVQCPVCTLYLLPGMELSDHLETHPKEKVIKALVQLSLKSEVSETVLPDVPYRTSRTSFNETNSNTYQNRESERSSSTLEHEPNDNSIIPVSLEVHAKRKSINENDEFPTILQTNPSSRHSFSENGNNSNTNNNSNNSIFPPPITSFRTSTQPQITGQTPPYLPHQLHSHNHHHYHPYNNYHPQSGNNSIMSQPSPLRLFSYQPPPKPLQPPPTYGTAISQLRSQNNQNVMASNMTRPICPSGHYQSGSFPVRPTMSVPQTSPNLRYPVNFLDAGPFSSESSSSRSCGTPPSGTPPQLYRSPSVPSAQSGLSSNSPRPPVMGSPSVLRYAESPVTAHYLERENGDFIVQETPKHVVECVEKDDGEFSVIERVYHMPPSVVQINEEELDDEESCHESPKEESPKSPNSETSFESGPTNTNQENQAQTPQRQKKKSGITVLSDVQLDINEYLDLVGNIIASSKVAKARQELIKIEKFEPKEEYEESENLSIPNQDTVLHKSEEIKDDLSSSNSEPNPIPQMETQIAPCTTSVIRLTANPNARCATPTIETKPNDLIQLPHMNIETLQLKDEGPQDNETAQNDKTPEDDKTHQNPDASQMDVDPKDDQLNKFDFPEDEEKPLMEPMKSIASTPTTDPVDPTAIPVQNAESFSNEPNSADAEVTNKIPIITENQQGDSIAKAENNAIETIEEPKAKIPVFQVKRPFRKVPKKIIIKQKCKETVPPPQSAESEQSDLPIEPLRITPSTSTETNLVDHPEKQDPFPEHKEDPQALDEFQGVKEETPQVITDASTLPLFADADEKLPADDDIQPSPTSLISTEEKDPPNALSDEKPSTDLTTLLDQCMKKEEIDEHPMHSIFGLEIEGPVEPISNTITSEPNSVFSTSSLFSKPLPSSDQLSAPETILPDNPSIHDQEPLSHHASPQSNNPAFSEYPFSFLYDGDVNHQDGTKHNISPPMYCNEDYNRYNANASTGTSTNWYQSQNSDQDFVIEEKGSYLDLDSCKRGSSFNSTTEGSMPTPDSLNIRSDEKMPAKGEISEQESNCAIENSWSQPLYNDFPVRFPNPYPTFMNAHESWSQDQYLRAQDLTSVDAKNFSLRLSDDSQLVEPLASTSKRKKTTPKVSRKKTFQCMHCSTFFPLLKEKNAHLIKQHGYKRVNRRLIRDPPTSTVTTATLQTSESASSLIFGMESTARTSPPAEEKDSKANIVKIEQENQDQKDEKEGLPELTMAPAPAPPTDEIISRPKCDTMRARDHRMLINFNLNALQVKKEGETHNYYSESKSSFFCFVCRQDFLTVKLFDEHLNTHPAECFTCHKKFKRWKNFMIHLKRHLGWKDFCCNYCEKKFVIRSALVEHVRMHTGQTPLKCKICGKSFKRYSNLTQHRKRHNSKINRAKEYVCYCGEVLPSKARFLWHKETHDVKPKCCPYCRDRFVHANSLRRHIRLAHSDKFDYTEPMECPMCKQIYAKSSIKAHMATHSVDNQHECLICNKTFSTKWNLKIHNWVHANRTTKPFKCTHCVKAFVREVDYNNHLNSHKQIKPYTCEYCGCKFIRKYNYIRHRREHHGNKKFTCDLCGKLFHRHYYLIEHRRIHTGERPFQCTICGKSSATKTNHNKHLKIHHSRDPFTSET